MGVPTGVMTGNASKHRIKPVAAQMANLVDRIGLKRAWLSLMIHRVSESSSPDRDAMLRTLRSSGGSILETENLLLGLRYFEVGVLYEFSLAHASHDSRREAGQFFTPDDVASAMAKRARQIDDGSDWLDPCCGLGNLTYWLAKEQDNPATFLKNRMWLIDQDKLALLLAAVMLTIEVGGETKGVFEALRSRSRACNFLTSGHSRARNAIVNPPYVVVRSDPSFRSRDSRDLYAYFLERILEHMRGVVAITPQSFTNAAKFAGLREVLTSELRTLDIYCFDNVPDNIFKGVKFGSHNSNMVNSTRAAIVVGTTDGYISDQRNVEEKRFRITPLLRWRSHERAAIFGSMDSMLSEFVPNSNHFPKIWPGQEILLAKLRMSRKFIGDLTTKYPTSFSLHVPSTPRYFISASKRILGRSSVKVIYFNSVEDQNLAYIVLNSELAYWWWRVFDGGMSLTGSTLMGIPIPDGMRVDKNLVCELEASEGKNIVYKLNAGMLAENIRHPNHLIERLTLSVLGDSARLLKGVRSNSDLAEDDRALGLASDS